MFRLHVKGPGIAKKLYSLSLLLCTDERNKCDRIPNKSWTDESLFTTLASL